MFYSPSFFFFYLVFYNSTLANRKQFAATWSPLHRVGLPIDIARVVCFLASQDGEWVNGKVIGIDGHAMM